MPRLTIAISILVTLWGALPSVAQAAEPGDGAMVRYPQGRSFPAPRAAAPTTVMAFNVRFGHEGDGEDAWSRRTHRVFEVIRRHAPDVLLLQEPFVGQVREIMEAFPRYASIGVYRLDGRLAGEGCITLYDRSRYTVAASGTFWLSDTPDEPGSATWGNSWPRPCAWARLVDLDSGDGLVVYNAHFDHRSAPSRERAADLIVSHMRGLSKAAGAEDPVIVGGDFNARPESAPLRTLLERGDLVDPFKGDARGTFTGFDLESDGGRRRIDFVLTSRDLEVVSKAVDRDKIDGRYPSDHFPVIVTVRRASPVPIGAGGGELEAGG